MTPIDEATGVPYVLVPTPDLPPIPRNGDNIARVADWHHPFHPRTRLHNQGAGPEALRGVRKQWALYERHHNEDVAGYHAIFAGPPLPETEDDLFRTVVFAAAGYIPPVGIDFQRAEPYRFKPLTNEERLHLWEGQQIRIDNESGVRNFLTGYVLAREFVDPTDLTVDEFLNTANRRHRAVLGNRLLKAAAYQSAESLSPVYRKAKKEALIHPARAHSVGRFVLGSMSWGQGRQRARQKLRQQLEAA